MGSHSPSVLQIGLGAFGWNHLRAWQEIGIRDRYWLADVSETALVRARSAYGLAADRLTTDFRSALERVDLVDIVTPTDSHYDICLAALEADKDVFVEKPMTMDASQARRIRDVVRQTGRRLQVGYYYRYHPTSRRVKGWIDEARLGALRYLSGSFMGFKRARNDVGVTHTDAVHFIDLFNWLTDRFPHTVYAVTRDHFGRGLEDWSLVVLQYPDNIVAKVESGYIQPGRWRDKVVANAYTTKEVAVCGSVATAEIDFEQEIVHLHRVHHELRDGVWTAVMEGTQTPNDGTASPIQMIVAELEAFLRAVDERRATDANEVVSGVAMADIVEAIYTSARSGQPQPVPAVGSGDSR